MKLIGTILLKYLKWILPVMLLDGCFNRDPYMKIDERLSYSAICGGCPKSLDYSNPNRGLRFHPMTQSQMKDYEKDWENADWSMEEVTDFLMSEHLLIGRSPEGYFIADRRDGRLHLFPGRGERDWMLREQYHLDPETSFHAPTQLMWMRSRLFWPWVELYYLCCLVVIPWLVIRAHRHSTRRFYSLP